MWKNTAIILWEMMVVVSNGQILYIICRPARMSFLFSGGACPSPLHAATKRCTRILQQISNSLHVTHHTHDAHPAGPGSVWNSCYPSALPSTSFSWPPGSALASLPSLPGYFTGSSLSLQISRFDFPPPELLCITSGLRDLIIYSQTVWRFHL